MTETILWEDLLRGGRTWSQVLEAGMALRLTDIEGGSNISAIFYKQQAPGKYEYIHAVLGTYKLIYTGGEYRIYERPEK